MSNRQTCASLVDYRKCNFLFGLMEHFVAQLPDIAVQIVEAIQTNRKRLSLLTCVWLYERVNACERE